MMKRRNRRSKRGKNSVGEVRAARGGLSGKLQQWEQQQQLGNRTRKNLEGRRRGVGDEAVTLGSRGRWSSNSARQQG